MFENGKNQRSLTATVKMTLVSCQNISSQSTCLTFSRCEQKIINNKRSAT